MYISSIQLNHILSFLNTQKIELSTGFNVIVGPNNAGKTALARSLKLESLLESHFSIHTKPYYESPTSIDSRIIAQVKITQHDLTRLLGNRTEFLLNYDGELTATAVAQEFTRNWQHNTVPQITIEYAKSFQKGIATFNNKLHTRTQKLKLMRQDDSKWVYDSRVNSNNASEDKFLEYKIPSFIKRNIYYFDAERLGIGSSDISQSNHGNLRSNAGNLPSVLLWTMTRKPFEFEQYVKIIRQVFPDIEGITLPIQNNSAEIKLWYTPLSQKREDLAFSLSKSGTGVGQVLSIVYVVVTSRYPQVIIIDEPQSFLHPGAIRKLFNILKQHDHQYIITTHSPIVISAANPDTLLLVRKENYQSHVQVINQQEKAQMNQVLRSVGANLSDVFGADNVLWVEGETEQECFPLILQKLSQKSLRGTVIRSVVATGDFVTRKKKNVDLIFEIYKRLTNNVALIPPAYGFIFDSEELSQDKQDDLKRRSKGEDNIERIAFLPRMMYENYLLHAEAISAVLNSSNYIEVKTTSEQIQQWVDGNFDEYSLETIHGATVLTSLFKAFSDNKLEYDKVMHGVALTEWIIKNDPDHLKSLVDFLIQQIDLWKPKLEISSTNS